MDKFQNRYRIATARAQWWNYGWNGAYFITICTKNREHFFGEIRNGKMHLSDIGKIAQIQWIKTFEMRPDMKLWMGEYVIMPNHFHAIIGIGENEYNSPSETQRAADRAADDGAGGTDAMHCVSTTPPDTNIKSNWISPKNKFGPQSKNLASIIRGFKTGVTTHARKFRPDFAWQSRFHDHIIRNNAEYQRISDYIRNNPAKWQNDKMNSDK
ncbi:MAG: transposase [Bacteroidales bacterium]